MMLQKILSLSLFYNIFQRKINSFEDFNHQPTTKWWSFDHHFPPSLLMSIATEITFLTSPRSLKH